MISAQVLSAEVIPNALALIVAPEFNTVFALSSHGTQTGPESPLKQ